MILVTGATGNVGRQLVQQLHSRGESVRALSRSPSPDSVPDGVEVVAGDLQQAESLRDAMAGVERMFLFRSRNETEVMAVAKEAGVRQVVLLSTVAAASRPESVIGHDHLRAEHAVADSGLDWTFMRPGGFASNSLGWAPMVARGTVYAPFSDIAIPLIHPGDIAAVAAVALSESGHEGQTYTLSGPAPIGPAAQVEAIAAAIGRELAYREITRDEAFAQMSQHLPAEIVEATLDFIGRPASSELVVQTTVEMVTGMPARTYSEWARDNADAFR